jgi:hypothetical protein
MQLARRNRRQPTQPRHRQCQSRVPVLPSCPRFSCQIRNRIPGSLASCFVSLHPRARTKRTRVTCVAAIADVPALFLQFAFRFCLTIAVLASMIRQRRAKEIMTRSLDDPKAAIARMTWQQFEQLVDECFPEQGFSVLETGGSRPDGGVDLVLEKNGRRYLAQCKHWKTRQVRVAVVRELNGVIAEQKADGGYVITGGYSPGTPKYLPVAAALSSSMASRWSECSSRLLARPAGRLLKPRTDLPRARAVLFAERRWNRSSLSKGSSKASRSGAARRFRSVAGSYNSSASRED